MQHEINNIPGIVRLVSQSKCPGLSLDLSTASDSVPLEALVFPINLGHQPFHRGALQTDVLEAFGVLRKDPKSQWLDTTPR